LSQLPVIFELPGAPAVSTAGRRQALSSLIGPWRQETHDEKGEWLTISCWTVDDRENAGSF
jgi:hypothetical protein